MVTIKLADCRGKLYQWDTGRKVVVDDETVKQVHYQNRFYGRTIDVDVSNGAAIIPDQLLQSFAPLVVFAWAGSAEDGYTKIEKTFEVHKRNKPAGYVFTPVDQKTLDDLQRQIGDLDDLATEAKENLVAAINEAAESGGAGSMDLRVADGYIQYSNDGGKTWENLIAVAELKGDKGDTGAQGAKGDPGAQGAKGDTGAAGADGITPTIGDNGNWYIGTTDTGKPSRGEKGDTGATGPQGPQGETGATGPQGPAGPAGAPGKDGAGMDITGATIGQIAKITAVDSDGKPTAWSPVDMPTGGGGDAWEEIYSATMEEEVSTFDADLGKSYKKIIIAINVGETNITANRTIRFIFNNYNKNVFTNNIMTSARRSMGFGIEVFDEFVHSSESNLSLSQAMNLQPFGPSQLQSKILNRAGIIPDSDTGINHVNMSTLTSFAFQAGEQIKIYGIEA